MKTIFNKVTKNGLLMSIYCIGLAFYAVGLIVIIGRQAPVIAEIWEDFISASWNFHVMTIGALMIVTVLIIKLFHEL